ncbi:MAG TPA: NAD(P)H-hydrate epimerase [Gaiellaceae bacterium]|nr:NAD(P)H-hydrate epimerase [Gaiellaceae bacterium]
MTEDDLERLRAHGLEDRAIVDANQVVSYYNYVNRVADGLGVQLEHDWPAQARQPRRYGAAAMRFPTVAAEALPWISVAQMREVDRLMIEEFAISLEQMMENAGRNLAVLARTLLGDVRGRRVHVLAGSGGNGGGGLAAARHLLAAGARVSMTLAAPPERRAPVTREHYEALARLDVPQTDELDDEELVIDALLGYSQKGAPSGDVAALIRGAEGATVLSLDVPSGLELESGHLHDPHMRATATLTLALPKQALRGDNAPGVVGDLYLADISVPPAVYERLGIRYSSPFGRSPLVVIDAGKSTA